MSKTVTTPSQLTGGKRKDGLAGLWGRIIHRDPDAYERWMEDRDLTIVTATLMRLNDRQLARLGFSRATLALDVEDLAARANREAEVALDILRVVEDGDDSGAANTGHAIAAE